MNVSKNYCKTASGGGIIISAISPYSQKGKGMRAKMIALFTALMAAMSFVVAAPTQAHAATRTGTVLCTGGTIYPGESGAVVGIWIHQPKGRSGWASFTRTDQWSANWSYDFVNDEPYQIRVGCGGTPRAWQSTNYGPTYRPSRASGDYICDVGRGRCILS